MTTTSTRPMTESAPVSTLVVDDEPELRSLLAEYFGRHGFTVRQAEDAAAARRLVDQHPHVDTLVLECTNMPPYRASIEAATGFKTLWLQDCAALFRPFEGA